MGIESLKSELSQALSKGSNSQQLLDLQKEIISDMKIAIANEIALVSVKKSHTVAKLFGLSFVSMTETGAEQLESLKADLRVVVGYEKLLEQFISQGEMAKASLQELESRETHRRG
jgi:hypothetical protein